MNVKKVLIACILIKKHVNDIIITLNQIIIILTIYLKLFLNDNFLIISF